MTKIHFADVVQRVFNKSQEQLMQFSKLPKSIVIAEREFPELVVDWINCRSEQIIHISYLQKLQVTMLMS